MKGMTGRAFKTFADRLRTTANLTNFHEREAEKHYTALKKEKNNVRRLSLSRDAVRHTHIAADYGVQLYRMRAL